MSNELATQQNNPINYSQEQIQVIKQTIAKDATDTELALFINQCKRTGLDAMTRQIYFMKAKDGKVSIQTSVDGFRLIAERSDKYEGQTQAEWCGDDGVWKDIWLSKTPPAAARVGVYKKGFREALYAVAIFDEYAQKNYQGELQFMWKKMPSLMIAKVAECLALRKAFPNDLSGLYAAEEMGQAAAPEQPREPKQVKSVVMSSPQAAPQQPTAGLSENDVPEFTPVSNEPAVNQYIKASIDPAYKITFGQYKDKTIEEVGIDKVGAYVGYLEGKARDENKPIKGQVLTFIQQYEARLN